MDCSTRFHTWLHGAGRAQPNSTSMADNCVGNAFKYHVHDVRPMWKTESKKEAAKNNTKSQTTDATITYHCWFVKWCKFQNSCSSVIYFNSSHCILIFASVISSKIVSWQIKAGSKIGIQYCFWKLQFTSTIKSGIFYKVIILFSKISFATWTKCFVLFRYTIHSWRIASQCLNVIVWQKNAISLGYLLLKKVSFLT